jgi:proline iminopeptidase
MSTAAISGANLYFEDVGNGAPIITLHGNGLDHTYLCPWHDELARDGRVVYFDQRLHGRSSRTGHADHASFHADIAGLADHLGIARSIIYGHSYGSWLAIGYALRYPERVSGLILCGTAPAFDYVEDIVSLARSRNEIAAAALLDGLQNGVASDDELRDLWARILPLYFQGPPRPDVLANVQYSADGYLRLSATLPTLSFVDALPSLRVPILVLEGASDFITPPSQGRRLVSLVPNGTYTELAGSGHFPFVEEPESYLDAIRRWRRTVGQ